MMLNSDSSAKPIDMIELRMFAFAANTKSVC